MKQKMNKDVVPNDFTLSLALVDSIPVIFFGLSMIVVSKLFNSGLFLFGALLCLIAGICKVLWKIIVVLKQRNIWFLFIQMRIIMPIGMIIMIITGIINRNNFDFSRLLTMPSILFFIIGIVGMLLMIIFGFCLDNKNVKANWLEQITNAIAQICFFIGLISLL